MALDGVPTEALGRPLSGVTGADGVTGASLLPRISRRTGLPGGRAIVGALLITVAAVGTFALATLGRDGTTTDYVVALRPIAPGARIERAALAMRPLTLDAATAAGAFTDPDRLVGSVALGPIGAGQLLQTASIAAPSRSDGAALSGHEFTFPIAKDRVPPSLKRGERVAVLATYGSGADARTITTVQDAVVIAFDADTENIGTRSTARLTLSLPDSPSVVETAHASQVADLTIVRSTFASSPLPTSYKPGLLPAKAS